MAPTFIEIPTESRPPSTDGAATSPASDFADRERALRIECARLESKVRRLKRLAFIDDLTGLANRRCFDHALDQEIRRASRTRLPLSLIICDVDHFKRFNDTFGHQCGDSALRLLGDLLSSSAQRAGDIAARYGGEEFALLLPSTGPMNALYIAEHLRSLVGKLTFFNGLREHPSRLSMSLGVTTHHSTSPCAPCDIVSAADMALYRAKSGGRNCVRYQAGGSAAGTKSPNEGQVATNG